MSHQLRPFYVTHEGTEYRVGAGPDDTARLFTVGTQKSKPHLTMFHRSPGAGPVVASAILHGIPSKFDFTLRNSGQPVVMKKSLLSSTWSFHIPPLGDLQWKKEGGGWSSSRNLVDKQGRVVARYEKGKRASLLGSRGDDTISVLNEQRFLDSFLELVVVTCVSTLDYDRQLIEAAGTAGAGGNPGANATV